MKGRDKSTGKATSRYVTSNTGNRKDLMIQAQAQTQRERKSRSKSPIYHTNSNVNANANKMVSFHSNTNKTFTQIQTSKKKTKSKTPAKDRAKVEEEVNTIGYNTIMEKYGNLLLDSTTYPNPQVKTKSREGVYSSSNINLIDQVSNDNDLGAKELKDYSPLITELVRKYIQKIKLLSDEFFKPLKGTTGSIHYSLKAADELSSTIDSFHEVMNKKNVFTETKEKPNKEATKLKQQNLNLSNEVSNLKLIIEEQEKKIKFLEKEAESKANANRNLTKLMAENEHLKGKIENLELENSHKRSVISYLEKMSKLKNEESLVNTSNNMINMTEQRTVSNSFNHMNNSFGNSNSNKYNFNTEQKVDDLIQSQSQSQGKRIEKDRSYNNINNTNTDKFNTSKTTLKVRNEIDEFDKEIEKIYEQLGRKIQY